MDSMPKKSFYALLAAFCLASVSAQDIPKKSFDGRFGSRCFILDVRSGKEVCVIPFQRILATPERYHRKVISLTGFLVNSFGRAVLFPDSESYRSDMQLEGIELIGVFSLDKSVKAGMDKGVFPVTVVGVFDATYQGADIFRLGAMREISSVASYQIVHER